MQKTDNPYDSLNFWVDLSLAECLQRFEDYRNRPQKITEAKKGIVTIQTIKTNQLYKIELSLHNTKLRVQLEATEDGCRVIGEVNYSWFEAIASALFMFCIAWVFSPVALRFYDAFLLIIVFLCLSFFLTWMVAVGSAETLKLRLKEILKENSKFASG